MVGPHHYVRSLQGDAYHELLDKPCRAKDSSVAMSFMLYPRSGHPVLGGFDLARDSDCDLQRSAIFEVA